MITNGQDKKINDPCCSAVMCMFSAAGHVPEGGRVLACLQPAFQALSFEVKELFRCHKITALKKWL